MPDRHQKDFQEDPTSEVYGGKKVKRKKDAQIYTEDAVKSDTPALQPTAVILLLAMSVVIVMIILLIYLYISPTSDKDEIYEDLLVPPPPGAIVADPEQIADETEKEEESTRFIPTQAGVDDYDLGFFSDTLFVGDSIFTGIDGYKYLPPDNVFAEVGISPAAVIAAELKGRTLFGKFGIAVGFDRAVIMMGANGLDGSNAATVAEDVYAVALRLKSEKPDMDVIILTVPPVREDNQYGLTKDKIDDFNAELMSRESQDENGNIVIMDFCSLLSDEDGYLRSEYAQPDGIHLKSAGYDVMFAMIQSRA